MSEILRSRRPRGISAAVLRLWGILFVSAGIAGKSIIENNMLDLGGMSSADLFNAMEADPNVMTLATIALVCQVVVTCAAPLFAFLLVEGFCRTSSFRNYLTRVALVALISEVPFNLAMGGKLFDFSTRNPAIALVICLVMLYFFRMYPGKSLKALGTKALVFVGAFLWCSMLRIEHGVPLVILTAVIWGFREKTTMRSLFGFSASMICSIFNVYYMASAMSFILIHMYNEEKGEQKRLISYAAYPAILLLIGVAAKFIG